MPRKRLTLCLLTAAAVSGRLFAAVYRFVGREVRINEEAAEKLQVGMTQAEVEAILGCPPADYTTHDIRPIELHLEDHPNHREPPASEQWPSLWKRVKKRLGYR